MSSVPLGPISDNRWAAKSFRRIQSHRRYVMSAFSIFNGRGGRGGYGRRGGYSRRSSYGCRGGYSYSYSYSYRRSYGRGGGYGGGY
jgi:hypothetical protein